FFFSSRRRHTRSKRDWSSDVCSSDLKTACARFTPNNSGQRSPPTYYRGCWHVVSRGFLIRYRQGTGVLGRYLFFPDNRDLRSQDLHHSRGDGPSDYHPSRTHPEWCLSPSVAYPPLRSATHRCFGELLPHQLANATRAHL